MLFDTIFGPIKSRRLGSSLGINVLPPRGKICNFDCIYCECGLNEAGRADTKFPSAQSILSKLEKRLMLAQEEGEVFNTLTFSGNGEPTLHPEFLDIVTGTVLLRDKYCPDTKVSVLTNATQLTKQEVFDALNLVDNPLLKLDTVNLDYIKLTNQPQTPYDLNHLIEIMKTFRHPPSIQTMFMKGEAHGQTFDNSTPEYVTPWLYALNTIRPRHVTIYTLDRSTPIKSLFKIDLPTLHTIADQVKQLGISCSVSG